jgi:hypothetical protein
MGKHFLYHFIEDGERRAARGVNDGYTHLSAAGSLVSIIKNSFIDGNDNKGYKQFIPAGRIRKSVSFTDKDLFCLDDFLRMRSYFSIAFKRDSPKLKDAGKVDYVKENSIDQYIMNMADLEKHFVDYVRLVSRGNIGNEYEPIYLYKRHDFKWESEWRVIKDRFEFTKDDIAFLTVGTPGDVKYVNDSCGLEALDIKSLYKLIDAYKGLLSFQECETPFKQVWDRSKRKGCFVLQEVVFGVEERLKDYTKKKYPQKHL